MIVSLPGLRGPAKALGNKASPLEVWDLLFTENMFDEIIKWTNRKLSQIRTNYKNADHSTLKDVDDVEMRAFFGLLTYTEVFKAGRESLEGLFATDGTGRDVFRCTMPRRRFETLLIALRFDNDTDRAERVKVDRATAISGIFQTFIDNSQKNFSLGAYVCVDESLVGFRGRCGFVMYMPKKPAKYGIKIMCLTDARNNYLYNAYIYCGKGSDSHGLTAEEKHFQIPTQSVIRLVKPIEKTNRNVTADNWFGSLELVTELQKRGLTFLGTLKKNKPMIPACFLPDKKREIGSNLYGYKENITLLSHVTKKNKAVLLISSMHHAPRNDQDTGKPEMIIDYNMTKGGVDSLDKKCENDSSCRRTRRWPMAVFLQMLNMCSINAYILHQSFKDSKPIDRCDFLKTLAKSLITPFMQRRYTENVRLSRELRSHMECLLQLEKNQEQSDPKDGRLQKKKTCSLCPHQIKRKTFFVCRECEKPICLEHAKKICDSCVKNHDK